MDTIPPLAFAAALGSALLHASWNVILKAARDTVLESAGLCGFWILYAAIALPFLGFPEPAAWPLLAVSVIVHVAYFWLLSIAYNQLDLSLVFPIQRGLPPLLVALAAYLLIGEVLAPAAWVGVALICGGVVLTSRIKGGGFELKALAFGLTSACMIAAYTTLDGLGARAAGSAWVYLMWLGLLQGSLFLATVYLRRGPALIAHFRNQWARSAGLGVMAIIGYGLALYAMTLAPLGPMTAIRESSVVFAAILGAIFLSEPLAGRRIAAAVVIVAGMVAIRLAG